MATKPSEIMTITDIAKFLRIPISSVYKLAHAGKIPGQKIGRHWRFYRPAIIAWLGKSYTQSKEDKEFNLPHDL